MLKNPKPLKSYSRLLNETHKAFAARVEAGEGKNKDRPRFLPDGITAKSISRGAAHEIFSDTARIPKDTFYDRVWALTQFQWSREELIIRHGPGATGHAPWRKTTEELISFEYKKGNLLYEGTGSERIYRWIGSLEALRD